MNVLDDSNMNAYVRKVGCKVLDCGGLAGPARPEYEDRYRSFLMHVEAATTTGILSWFPAE